MGPDMEETLFGPRRRRGDAGAASTLAVISGAWLMLSAFGIVVHGDAYFWSNLLCGLIVVLLECAFALGVRPKAWMNWGSVVIGVWVMISPWVLGFNGRIVAIFNNVFIGSMIAWLALWSESQSKAGASS